MRSKKARSTMRYLGGFSGAGVLKCDGKTIERAVYELDLFFEKLNGIAGSGEIRLPAAILESVFCHQNIQLLTDGGRLLNVHFSEKILSPDTGIAHVDVTGDLKAASRELRT